MKNTSLGAVVLVVLMVSSSCSKIETRGGFGDQVDTHIRTKYVAQEMGKQDIFQGVRFKLRVQKSAPNSPVEAPLDYILEAFKTELEANKARVVSDTASVYDVYLNITLSRYVTRRFGAATFRTYTDFHYECLGGISNNLLAEKTHSISGSGEFAPTAGMDALSKFVKIVLENKKMSWYLASMGESNADLTTHSLNKLSVSMLKGFEKKGPKLNGLEAVRMGFVGFSNDETNEFTSHFLAILQRHWLPPRFRFFSRNQLDKVLREHSLQMSGLTDNRLVSDLGKIKAVDYVVVGNISRPPGKIVVAAQILRINDGEVVVSKTTSMKR